MWLFWTCLFLQLQHIGRTLGKGGGVVGGVLPQKKVDYYILVHFHAKYNYFSIEWFHDILWHTLIAKCKDWQEKSSIIIIIFLSLRAKRVPSLNNTIDGIFKLMLLNYVLKKWRMWNFQGVWLSRTWRGIWSMHELSISETICKVVER